VQENQKREDEVPVFPVLRSQPEAIQSPKTRCLEKLPEQAPRGAGMKTNDSNSGMESEEKLNFIMDKYKITKEEAELVLKNIETFFSCIRSIFHAAKKIRKCYSRLNAQERRNIRRISKRHCHEN